ncbi:flavodoxin reductase [Maritalea mobilis]|uniref:FAD-binding oxidoreductase n=1 Tax=Maritalea mobilis TaxID=483324 RepID=UPI001C942D77|nr:FAD-binding oxidoreductase [Maritalea mobilis]MBY6200184.1 flavodoxin reductase [Maritalea mobilis]
MTHAITLQAVVPLTHDTRHYVFSRPPEYDFTPGQATDVALDRDGWREEQRPFTFTGAPEANVLTFTIKSYADHDGVTKRLWELQPGDRIVIEEPWGAIHDAGPGTFIAGGAGITPFLGILGDRARSGTLKDCRLIFSNKTEADIILKPYWDTLKDLDVDYLLSAPEDGSPGQKPDGDTLDELIGDWDQRFYVCGPPPMEEAVVDHLKKRGVSSDRIIQEE